jgi:hypothetical protein
MAKDSKVSIPHVRAAEEPLIVKYQFIISIIIVLKSDSPGLG